jgi:hypothetical protein
MQFFNMPGFPTVFNDNGDGSRTIGLTQRFAKNGRVLSPVPGNSPPSFTPTPPQPAVPQLPSQSSSSPQKSATTPQGVSQGVSERDRIALAQMERTLQQIIEKHNAANEAAMRQQQQALQNMIAQQVIFMCW